MISQASPEQQAEFARRAIGAMQAGILPDIEAEECGVWEPYIDTLKTAFVTGGLAGLNASLNILSADLTLAGLLADDDIYNHHNRTNGHNNHKPPKPFPVQLMLDESTDDLGNAQCVLAVYGGMFLYCEAYGYLAWNGHYWQAENGEAALDKAIVHTLHERRVLAARANRDSVVNCSKPSARHIKDCKFVLTSKITVSVSEFDESPRLLNCQNGVVDLATGSIMPHDPAQRFTYCVPVEYDPKADRSLWVNFLKDVVDGGDDAIEYLQRAVGYGITGYTREECLFYVHGPTRSGKGTFSETLLALFPKPIGVEVDFNTFTSNRDQDNQNFDLAPLKPARLIFASEPEKQQKLNTGKIKSLTGGNDVRCAFKHRDHFSYRPQYKIFLVSNHTVNTDPDDDAVWGRLRVILFPTSRLNQEDKHLKARMQQPENLKGILAWVIEGAIKWFASSTGLKTPQCVIDAGKAQRNEIDFVGMWLAECCQAIAGNWTASSVVYQSYKNWCVDNGRTPKQTQELMNSLRNKGFQTGVRQGSAPNRVRGVVGLRIMP